MKYNRTALALAVAVVGTVIITGCKKKEEPVAAAPAPVEAAPAPVETAPPEISFASLTVGNSADADGNAVAGTTFGAKDKIYATTKTEGVSTNATIVAKLTYQDGQTAGEDTKTIAPTGPASTTSVFTKATDWPKGKYKVEVTLNGTPAGSQEIEVK